MGRWADRGCLMQFTSSCTLAGPSEYADIRDNRTPTHFCNIRSASLFSIPRPDPCRVLCNFVRCPPLRISSDPDAGPTWHSEPEGPTKKTRLFRDGPKSRMPQDLDDLRRLPTCESRFRNQAIINRSLVAIMFRRQPGGCVNRDSA
jgi:hypothetical protein